MTTLVGPPRDKGMLERILAKVTAVATSPSASTCAFLKAVVWSIQQHAAAEHGDGSNSPGNACSGMVRQAMCTAETILLLCHNLVQWSLGCQSKCLTRSAVPVGK